VHIRVLEKEKAKIPVQTAQTDLLTIGNTI